MNAVEIEEAVSELAAEPFDRAEFAFRFLVAFGNKETTIKRLRHGATNVSDVPGGVLQRNHIHIATCDEGTVDVALTALRASPKTVSGKAKFILATDGETLQAEDLVGGETIACDYPRFADHFGFFLPLAGISTVKEIKNNPIDIKATGRLNKLYIELLKDNPDWAGEARRHELNQFMARLIFCFFAEDTGIFRGDSLFTKTVEQMSEAGHGTGDLQWGNTHEVVQHLFLAMDTPVKHLGNFDDRHRKAAGIKPWADVFPYVNGGMFDGSKNCPRFSRIARSYLLRAGELNWTEINPDIFGSMIQAVADDGERGELGMHYTSVPNILKVLNPLFLDDLREKLAEAGDNVRKLRNLRRRIAAIRVFDPACGSGNFLVIAYKELRAIEHAIVERLNDEPKSMIRLDNFYGIEIKGFAAEIARLALLIAEFQADCIYLSQQEARAMVLPLHRTGQIRVGNALRMDWLEVCPPVTKAVVAEHDLAGPTGRMALEDNGLGDGGEPETFICGNPPYKGYNRQTDDQKEDLRLVFAGETASWKSLDYVSGWFGKLTQIAQLDWHAAFVSTNSICQGEHASILWPIIFGSGGFIRFAAPNFRWSNSASNNAVVTVSIIGLSWNERGERALFDGLNRKSCHNINQYLVAGPPINIQPRRRPLIELAAMDLGNMPKDGGNLLLSDSDAVEITRDSKWAARFIFDFVGSQEFVKGIVRKCLWIEDFDANAAAQIPAIATRLDGVRQMRLDSDADSTRAFADRPHRFKQIQGRGVRSTIVVPKVTSETRTALPVGLLSPYSIVSDNAFALYDAPLWNMALIASRTHLVWIATVCGKLETRYRYSNTLGWNTFPVPPLTEQNKADLTRCAEDILLAREAHFPATIADLYDPDAMPDDLRRAHEANDETLERIYIGRRFRNDTERLEKLFALYTEMTTSAPAKVAKKKVKA